MAVDSAATSEPSDGHPEVFGSSYNLDSCTRIYKRPFHVFNKSFSDIYVTTRVPMSVYFKRTVELLSWHMSGIATNFGDDFFQNAIMDKSTGKLHNKAKRTTSSKDCENMIQTVANILTRRNAQTHKIGQGVNIYASGFCVKTAFYILQDIYTYVAKMFLRAAVRDNIGTPLLCYACRRIPPHCDYLDLLRIACIECKPTICAHAESVVSAILKVTIKMGTLGVHDDIVVGHYAGKDISSYRRTNVSISNSYRPVSVVKVSIYPSQTLYTP